MAEAGDGIPWACNWDDDSDHNEAASCARSAADAPHAAQHVRWARPEEARPAARAQGPEPSARPAGGDRNRGLSYAPAGDDERVAAPGDTDLMSPRAWHTWSVLAWLPRTRAGSRLDDATDVDASSTLFSGKS